MKFFKKKFVCDSFSNVIAEGTTFLGDINFTGTLQVEGTINGVKCWSADGCINIEKTGKVIIEEIRANDVIISGDVICKNIIANNSLTIRSTAKICDSTLFYKELQIESGANIHACVLENLNQTRGDTND